MFRGSSMLSEFFRDLITPINPRSRFTFLNFLLENDRLSDFLARGNVLVERREFQQYLTWAVGKMRNIELATRVNEIGYSDTENAFVLHTTRAGAERALLAANVVIGVGGRPHVPENLDNCDKVVHSSRVVDDPRFDTARTILVVGSGQTAGEIIRELLPRVPAQVRNLTWVTRSATIYDIDESRFSAECFSTPYATRFFQYGARRRSQENTENLRLTRGIAGRLSGDIVERLYSLRHVEQNADAVAIHCFSKVELVGNEKGACTIRITPIDSGDQALTETKRVELIIAATGFGSPWDAAVSLLQPSIQVRSAPGSTLSNYALDWSGPNNRKIFLQSASVESHGQSDTNLITGPARNSRILATVVGADR